MFMWLLRWLELLKGLEVEQAMRNSSGEIVKQFFTTNFACSLKLLNKMSTISKIHISRLTETYIVNHIHHKDIFGKI